MSDEKEVEVVDAEPVDPKMTPQDMVNKAGALTRPWLKPLRELAHAYLKTYPPRKVSRDVLNAVTINVPMRAFMALLYAGEVSVSLMVQDQPEASNDAVHSTDNPGSV